MSKKLLIDTDIGGDCDDAGALLLAANAHLDKDADLLSVTSCTTMEGAEECVRAILAEKGVCASVGIMRGEPFMESRCYSRYARAVKQKFPAKSEGRDSLDVLWETLSAHANCTLVAIGPQRNLSRFLDYERDGATGKELLSRSVIEVVVMGGTFADPPVSFEGKRIKTEWNILQDIPAAADFARRCLVPLTYVPFETGYDVLTGKNIPPSGAAGLCYRLRGENGLRASWDPCAVYYAIYGCGGLFSLSEPGSVRIDSRGRAAFTAGEGNRRVLRVAAPKEEIATRLDALMR